MRIKFVVYGTPRSTQTGSVVGHKGRSFPVRRNPGWSQLVALEAMNHRPPKPFAGPLRVMWTIGIKRPKKPRGSWPTGAPDCTNVIKGPSDALNGILWVDDAQIVSERIDKFYTATPGLGIDVEEL